MAIIEAIKNNPVRYAALGAIVINLAVSFGLHLTADQVAQLNALIVGLIGLIVPSFTTSVNSPSLPQGTQVEVITPQGQPNTMTTL